LLKLSGPSYLRVGKYGEPAYQADDAVVLGRARLLREGDRADFAVVSTGQIASVVLDAMELLKPDGIAPTVMQFHTVQPLDTAALDALADKVHTIIVVEEHLPVGGLAAGISTWRAARSDGPRIVRLGPPHALVLGNPTVPEMRKRLGFDAAAIAAMCRTIGRPAARGGILSTANARLTSDPI